MQKQSYLKLEKRAGIATVTVNRPESLNALNVATLKEFQTVLDLCREDDTVGTLILTGAGAKAFVAGADITELEQLDPAGGKRFSERGQQLFDQIEAFPKPVLAAINGFCLGGGCELAMACALRIAGESAVFGLPETKLGLIPGYGGTQRLPRLVGSGWAMQLILTGEMITAAEAQRIGLVNEVVPDRDLMERCRVLAGKILRNGPLAVQLAAESIRRGSEMPVRHGLSLEASLFGVACSSEDVQEGVRAFLEKRPASFKGK